jgi:hypothetical protein
MISQALEETIGYEDFRIELFYNPNAERFDLHASSLAGETFLPDFRFPVSFREVDEAFAEITRSRAQFTRNIQRVAIDNIKTLGSRLFVSLYESYFGELYQKSFIMAGAKGRNLRLRFVMNHPWMAAMPWEFLFDTTRLDFLTLSTRSPILRQWVWPTSARPVPKNIEPPLRVLVAFAEILQADRGTAMAEIEVLKQLETSGAMQFEILPEATPAKLVSALRQKSFHLLHLIMSGAQIGTVGSSWRENPNAALHEPPQHGLLMLSDTANSPSIAVDGFSLQAILQTQKELQLINLSGDQTDWLACQTTATCPATIGWRGHNTVEAYLSFAKGFYGALIEGTPLEVAVTQGRKGIDVEYPGGKEWGMPVFYMQTENSFTLRHPKPLSDSTSSARSISRSKGKGPSDSSSDREWTKLQVLMASAEENHQALLEEVKKYDDQAVPDYLTLQLEEEKSRIDDFKEQLRKLDS